MALSDGERVLPLATAQGLQADRRRRHRSEHRRHGRPQPGRGDVRRGRGRGAGRRSSTRRSAAMAAEGRPFIGVLYAGLMLTAGRSARPRVQRPLRRPRGQAILLRLEDDLLDVLAAGARGRIRGPPPLVPQGGVGLHRPGEPRVSGPAGAPASRSGTWSAPRRRKGWRSSIRAQRCRRRESWSARAAGCSPSAPPAPTWRRPCTKPMPPPTRSTGPERSTGATSGTGYWRRWRERAQRDRDNVTPDFPRGSGIHRASGCNTAARLGREP